MAKLFLILSMLSALALGIVPSQALAFSLGGPCDVSGTGSSVYCQQKAPTSTNPLTGPKGIILKVADFIALIAGIAAIFVIISGGLKYITSGGEPAKTQAAKNTIMYALIGLVVIALAGAIISFVLSNV